ncbi:MAG TPA: helix-turn-helix transcriptional regulator [Symbiobacteriaceae bacterium]|jgi:PadR family transcriptional regulator, regulatory protein PadR|nr:helix-turn-helix transcriptional regulator [Symbiobacteriaceae bacterium]
MRINKELLKGSTVIVILALLDRQPMYGYEMLAEIERTSGGVFQFKEGTLYPILHALESEGYVESYWSEAESTRKRKYYRITAEGGSLLATKRTEWVLFRSAVDRVVEGGGAP